MCKATSPPALPTPSSYVEQQGGVRLEGIHNISLALSGTAILGIAALILVWCYLNRRRQCCLNQPDVNPVSLQPMPLMMAPPAQAQAQLQLMPSAPPASMPPTVPQADVENQLAMIRAQQDAQLAIIRQQLLKEPAVDANQQAIIAAKENKYPVV